MVRSMRTFVTDWQTDRRSWFHKDSRRVLKIEKTNDGKYANFITNIKDKMMIDFKAR